MRVFRFTSAFLAGVALTASPAFTQDAPPAAESATTAKVDAGQAAAEPGQTDAKAPTGNFALDFSLAGVTDYAFIKNKRDWSIGVSADVVGFTVGANYVKAGHIGAEPLGKGRFLLSLTRSFSTSF